MYSDGYHVENYGSVLRDCSKALTINPEASKAYYRSGLALLALDRIEEAIDCCDRCSQFDEANAGIQSLRESVMKRKEEKGRKEREKQERIKAELDVQRRLRSAYAVSEDASQVRRKY